MVQLNLNLSDEFVKLIYPENQEINKNNFMTIWKYLENEQLKLKNLF